jgi:hypothetical protein
MPCERSIDSDAVREHLTELRRLPLSDPKARALASVIAAVAEEATAYGQVGARAFYDRVLPLCERAFALGALESSE